MFQVHVPIDIWFEIGILLDRYDEYFEFVQVFPKLQTPDRLSQARRRLTKNVNTVFGQSWTLDGKFHREDDLPAYTEGYVKHYYKYGEKHRDNDLPAFINRNQQYSPNHTVYMWYRNGYLHRDGGLPAVIFANGDLQYWVNGKRKYYDTYGRYEDWKDSSTSSEDTSSSSDE